MTGPRTIRKQIHITGASGSGVTTLGRALSDALGFAHLDTDDFFWLPTHPPYTAKRSPEQRLALLHDAFEYASSAGWILSGTLEGWGDPLIPLFGLVVFLSAPTELRMKRLQARELERFGAEALLPEGSMHEAHMNFLNWAAGYDEGIQDGRSRPRHEAWLAQLPCPVLRVDGSSTVNCLVQQVLTALG